MRKATHQQTKSHNTLLVLKTIYDRGRVSRADVARVTGLTRASVSNITANLIDEGLVTEVGQGESAGGKRPILLSVVDDSRRIIGIDLANGVFRGCVLNLRGKIRRRTTLQVEKGNGQAALARLYELIDSLVEAAPGGRFLGIGIGSPGVMGPEGVVRRAVNLDWEDIPLADLLRNRYHLPVCIANDCHAAALAEYAFGSSGHISNLVVLKVGRGTGAGVVMDGELHYGDSFAAGEIGHLVISPDGDECECGRRGCLETVASSRAIVKRAKAVAEALPSSLIRRQVSRLSDITVRHVVQALDEGDVNLRPIIADAGRFLGEAAAFIVSVLSVRRIVIAGSAAAFEHHLIEPMVEELRRRAFSTLAQETQVTMSTLGEDIVILGAAALLLAQELNIVGPRA
jgi:predicted NBD/HSP70 family sugar kinase